MRRIVIAAALALSAASLAEEPVTIGDKATAAWSATTEKAAATPGQKAVLEAGRPGTVTGEVVEVSCFLQLGKRGAKHIPCGTRCIQSGQPIGIVDDRGELTLLFAEPHDPRRDGQADLKTTFLPLLAKRVTVSGMLTRQKGRRALYVDGSALAPTSSR